MLLVSPKTGMAEAILDASYLTNVRTGAMTGVAAEYLARGNAETLGIVGTGAQARTQMDGIVAVRPIRRIDVWSRSAENVVRFVEDAARLHPDIEIRGVSTAETAVMESDIVVAATTSSKPVIMDPWVRPGTLVCSVGSHTPDAAEIAPGIVARAARVVVDTRPGSLKGAGDISGPVAAGLFDELRVAELGELVLGHAPGRGSDDEITVFKSVGFAAIDLVAATMVVKEARERGLGSELSLHD